MSLRSILILVAASWIMFVAGWLLAPASTDKRLVLPKPIARPIRAWRSFWMRVASTTAGWPHVIDVMAGYANTEVGTTPSRHLWAAGTPTLVRYEGERTRRDAYPILLVHAMVTRPWILDLTPQTSVVRALVAEGFDVYMLDWGDAGERDAVKGFDDYVQLLLDAEARVRAVSGAERVHLAGYCSGALLCMMRAAALPHASVASIVRIAGPIRLATNKGMTRLMRTPLLRPVLALDERGLVPASVVRASFQSLRPAAIRTVARGLAVRKSRDTAIAYGGLSRWAWEQRAIPGALFFDLVELFRTDSLSRGTLHVHGRTADVASIQCPTLAITSERDHIMPSADPEPGTQVVSPGGHVSLLTGSTAKTVLLPALVDWFAGSNQKQKA